MSPSISVIVPLYNKEKYVAEAINSVLNQTFQDFEVVVVDDASTDYSMRIVERFTNKKIVKLHNDKNRGVSYTQNEECGQLAVNTSLYWVPTTIIFRRSLKSKSRSLKSFLKA